MDRFRFTLNGQEEQVEGRDPHTTLLQYLRDTGRTGAKEGCAEGECGACAVVLVRPGPGGQAAYQAVNSCLLLLPAVAGQEVYTVEGLARGGRLHPVQEALVRCGASQCGYCTPGFAMSLFAEYYRPGRTGASPDGQPGGPDGPPGWDPEALAGNLCRCTGYRPIRAAARALPAPAPGDPFRQRLAAPAPPLAPVAYEAGGVRFYRPQSLAELFALLARHPGARLIAGGTDVAVAVHQHGARWPALIALEAVRELQACAREAAAVELGAGLTLSELQARLGGRVPLLEELFPLFGSRLIRNRATLGGNLATASPVGDAAPVLLALGAELRLASAGGERILPLDRFFTGYRRTALAPGEVIAAIRIPRPFPALARYYKVAKRRRDDISTVSAAFALDLDDARRVVRARLAYGGMAPTPVRCPQAEAALLGQPWGEAAVRRAQQALAAELHPVSDHRGSAAYRQAVALNLLQKFLLETGG